MNQRLHFHYGFVIIAVTFVALLAAAGLRAAPGVLILPLELAFRWDRATVSAGAGLGILANGLVGPFAGAFMQTYGIKRVLLAGLAVMALATSASLFMTEAWQYLLTWGFISGIGSGTVAGVLAAAIVNRWFARRQGLMMGVLTASTATGSLIFLPLFARLSQGGDWRPVVSLVSMSMAVLIPIVWLFLRERPEALNLRRYGEQAEVEPPAPTVRGGPFAALHVLKCAADIPTFWLLFGAFFICGFTTNGVIGTHLIAFCGDHGIPSVQAAGWLAVMGVFDLMGATASGWLSDRYEPLKLLVVYFSIRGLALLALPFIDLGTVSLTIFAVFFGLDWIATVPPTLKLVNRHFGQTNGPIVYGWIFTAHQSGAAAGCGRSRLGPPTCGRLCACVLDCRYDGVARRVRLSPVAAPFFGRSAGCCVRPDVSRSTRRSVTIAASNPAPGRLDRAPAPSASRTARPVANTPVLPRPVQIDSAQE